MTDSRKVPATAAVLISLGVLSMSVLVVVIWGLFGYLNSSQQAGEWWERGIGLGEAGRKIEAYQREHGALPNDVQGQELLQEVQSSYPIRYRWIDDRNYELRSAYSDGLLGTADDYVELHSVR